MKILVVEDDLTTRRATVDCLKARHFDLEVVETGEAAIKCAKDFDIIIIDYVLAGVSALSTAQTIKIKYPGDLPAVIVLTRKYGNENDMAFYSAGVRHLVDKNDPDLPYKLTWHIRTLEKLLAAKR